MNVDVAGAGEKGGVQGVAFGRDLIGVGDADGVFVAHSSRGIQGFADRFAIFGGGVAPVALDGSP